MIWTVVSDKTLESPLDCKEIRPVNPKENQSWIFIGRTDTEAETPILWLSDAKNWLIGKDPDAGKDWRWGGEGDDRGWDCWMASPIWWTLWVLSNLPELVMGRKAWHPAVHGVAHDLVTELNWYKMVVHFFTNIFLFVISKI